MKYIPLKCLRFLLMASLGLYAFACATPVAGRADGQKELPKVAAPAVAAPAADAAAADAVAGDAPEQEQFPNHDRTEEVLAQMQANGVEQLQRVQVGDIQLFIGITSAAYRIVERNAFDVRGPGVGLPQMQRQLVDSFSQSLAYLTKLLPDVKMKEIYIAIEDFGDGRQTSSGGAKVNSRVILMDIRRLHKNMVRGELTLISTTSAHELTHVLTYERDWNETNYHRELTGVLFEQLHYIRLYGQKAFSGSYLREHTIPMQNARAEAQKVLRHTGVNNTTLRYLLYNFLCNVAQGEYQLPEKDQDHKGLALERLAAQYIKSEKHGDEGFDDACERAGLSVDGVPLTMERIRQDCSDALLR